MLSFETLDLLVTNIFMIGFAALLVVALFSLFVGAIYFVVKTIYCDFKSEFIDKRNGRK